MTEQELIEMAKTKPWELDDVDKSKITEKVLDSLPDAAAGIIKYIYAGVDEKLITKRRILRFLPYDTDIYKVVPENLKNDADILETLACRFGRLPKSLFKNDDAIRYVLNKWNTNKTWAVYEKDAEFLIIKTNREDYPYCIYYAAYNVGQFDVEFFDSLNLNGLEPEEAAMVIGNNIIHLTQHWPIKFSKTI